MPLSQTKQKLIGLKRPNLLLTDNWLQANPSKRLSERFINRIGARVVEPDIRERLERSRHDSPVRHGGFDSRRLGGRLPFRGHDSGDELEKDTGEDLRVELDGKRAANMVIQVTRSPRKEEVSFTIKNLTHSVRLQRPVVYIKGSFPRRRNLNCFCIRPTYPKQMSIKQIIKKWLKLLQRRLR